MADDLEHTIRDNAQGPAQAHGDSGGMRQHSLKDQIETDRYLSAKNAVRTRRKGLRLTRLLPPGTT